MKTCPWTRIGTILIACTLTSAGVRAGEVDLRPDLGVALQEIIKTGTPDQFREHVTTDRLTVDDRDGTVKGRVTVQYGDYKEIPGIRNPAGGWIRRPQRVAVWSARLVVHWTAPLLNIKPSDITVDVGQIHGAVSTESVRSVVVDWVKRQTTYISRYVRGGQTSRSISYKLTNDTGSAVTLEFTPTGNTSRLAPGQSTSARSPVRDGEYPKVKAIAPGGAYWLRTIKNDGGDYRIVKRHPSGIQIVP